MIVIPDDPPVPTEEPRFPDNFGYWTKRTEADAYEVRPILLSKDSDEFAQIKTLLEERLVEGRKHRTQNLGYGAHIYADSARVKAITRIENPFERDLFLAMKRKMIHLNSQRDPDRRFQGSPEAVAFHGTRRDVVEKIFQLGFKVSNNFVCTGLASDARVHRGRKTGRTPTDMAPTPTTSGRLRSSIREPTLPPA